MSDLPDIDFGAWATTRPWWDAAVSLLLAGVHCVSVRDSEMPPWPHYVILTVHGLVGHIVVDRRRVGWTVTVRSSWEELSND